MVVIALVVTPAGMSTVMGFQGARTEEFANRLKMLGPIVAAVPDSARLGRHDLSLAKHDVGHVAIEGR